MAGWASFGITGLCYGHVRGNQLAARVRGGTQASCCPGSTGLARRWLLGTHQGSGENTHLQSYLNEGCFRFNRRRSRTRGLVFNRVLKLAVGHHPVRYRDLVAHPSPRRSHPWRWTCQVAAERRAPTGGPALANRSPGIARSDEYPMAGYRRIADDPSTTACLTALSLAACDDLDQGTL